jgi:hypothetical protein
MIRKKRECECKLESRKNELDKERVKEAGGAPQRNQMLMFILATIVSKCVIQGCACPIPSVTPHSLKSHAFGMDVM